MPPTVHIATRVPPDMKARLEELAAEEGKTCSQMIKDLVERRFEVSCRDTGGGASPSPGTLVSLELVLDEMFRFQKKLSDIEELMTHYEVPPSPMVTMRDVCQRRLVELSVRLEALDQERAEADDGNTGDDLPFGPAAAVVEEDETTIDPIPVEVAAVAVAEDSPDNPEGYDIY